MPESWFELSSADQSQALEVAAGRSGRPAHLLEKDIWVVWALSAIYDSPLGDSLTFKGGTSLSKVYKVIDRFSEDIDLTYDIRELVPDLLRDGNPIPASASQEKKITSAVRSRLPQWIEQTVKPVIDVGIAERAVLRLISVPLTDGQFDALVSFTFNLGAGALQRSTLRRKVNHGEHESVPAELMKWVWAAGKRLPGLIRRRKAEALHYGWLSDLKGLKRQG